MREESDLATGAGGPDDRPEIDPFDPVALEERLKDARVRRERAIAMRASKKPSVPQPQAKPPAPIEPARARASRGRRNLYVVAMFVAGAGLGATAASLSQAPQFQQARAFLAQTSGKSGDGGLAPSANVQEPPSLGMIGISELPAIDAGSSEATGPDLPEIRKVAGISKPEPTGSAGPAPEAWIPAGAAAPPRFTRSPTLPVPRPGAGLAAGPPSRPEASRASVLPPVLFDTSVASPPLPGSSLVYLNVPVTVSEEIAAAALETLRAAGIGEVFLASVSIPISRTNVRYYFDADAAHAGRISDLLEPALGEGGVEARDFTGYDPKPEPGTIEVWFAGDAPIARERTVIATRAPSPVRSGDAAPARATGFFNAAKASLAGLLGSSDGPGASASTRGTGGPAAIATSAAPRTPASQAASPSVSKANSAQRSPEPAATRTNAARATASPKNTSDKVGKAAESSGGGGKSASKAAGRTRAAKAPAAASPHPRAAGRTRAARARAAASPHPRAAGRTRAARARAAASPHPKAAGTARAARAPAARTDRPPRVPRIRDTRALDRPRAPAAYPLT